MVASRRQTISCRLLVRSYLTDQDESLPRKCPVNRPIAARTGIFILRGAPKGHDFLRAIQPGVRTAMSLLRICTASPSQAPSKMPSRLPNTASNGHFHRLWCCEAAWLPQDRLREQTSGPRPEAGDVLGNTVAVSRLLGARPSRPPRVDLPGRPGRPRSQHIPEQLSWPSTSAYPGDVFGKSPGGAGILDPHRERERAGPGAQGPARSRSRCGSSSAFPITWPV